jgi:hypothetical protein
LTISGRVQSDADEQGNGAGAAQIMLQRVGPSFGGEVPTAKVAKDGSFTLRNVFPGRWLVTPIAGGLAVRSATFGEHDISPDAALVVPPGGGGPLNLVLTAKQVQLSVTVSGAENAAQAQILVCPKDAEQNDSPAQRTFMINSQGPTTVVLPPGSYRLYAMESPNPWAAIQDPQVWHAIGSRGKAVDLKDDSSGATASLTLDLIRRDDLRFALDHEGQ